MPRWRNPRCYPPIRDFVVPYRNSRFRNGIKKNSSIYVAIARSHWLGWRENTPVACIKSTRTHRYLSYLYVLVALRFRSLAENGFLEPAACDEPPLRSNTYHQSRSKQKSYATTVQTVQGVVANSQPTRSLSDPPASTYSCVNHARQSEGRSIALPASTQASRH